MAEDARVGGFGATGNVKGTHHSLPKDCAGCSFLPFGWFGGKGRETWESRRPDSTSTTLAVADPLTRTPSPVRLKGADRLTGGCGPAPPRRPPTPLTLEEPSSNHTVLERPRGPNCRQAGRGWGRRGGAVLSSRSPSPFRPRSIELPPCPLAGGSWRRLRAR